MTFIRENDTAPLPIDDMVSEISQYVGCLQLSCHHLKNLGFSLFDFFHFNSSNKQSVLGIFKESTVQTCQLRIHPSDTIVMQDNNRSKLWLEIRR